MKKMLARRIRIVNGLVAKAVLISVVPKKKMNVKKTLPIANGLKMLITKNILALKNVILIILLLVKKIKSIVKCLVLVIQQFVA